MKLKEVKTQMSKFTNLSMTTQDVFRYHTDVQNYKAIQSAIEILKKYTPDNHISISILREQREAIKRSLDYCDIDIDGAIYDDFMKKS